MGWGYYEPCMVYGFAEPGNEDFLDDRTISEFNKCFKVDIRCGYGYASKGYGGEYYYGIKCTVDTQTGTCNPISNVENEAIQELHRLVCLYHHESPESVQFGYFLVLFGDSDDSECARPYTLNLDHLKPNKKPRLEVVVDSTAVEVEVDEDTPSEEDEDYENDPVSNTNDEEHEDQPETSADDEDIEETEEAKPNSPSRHEEDEPQSTGNEDTTAMSSSKVEVQEAPKPLQPLQPTQPKSRIVEMMKRFVGR